MEGAAYEEHIGYRTEATWLPNLYYQVYAHDITPIHKNAIKNQYWPGSSSSLLSYHTVNVLFDSRCLENIYK